MQISMGDQVLVKSHFLSNKSMKFLQEICISVVRSIWGNQSRFPSHVWTLWSYHYGN